MAVLQDADRVQVSGDLQREASRTNTALPGMTKADIKAAIDATDTWIDTNAAAFNTALPVAARTNLTAQQKAQLFLFVAKRRYEVS